MKCITISYKIQLCINSDQSVREHGLIACTYQLHCCAPIKLCASCRVQYDGLPLSSRAYLSVTARSDSCARIRAQWKESCTCNGLFFSFFAGALKALICMLGRCQVAHTHNSFCTDKAAEGMGKKMERYPSIHAYHRKGKRRRRIPVLKKATRYFVGKTIRFACRPCRYGFLTHSLFSSQPKRQPRPALIVLEKKGRGKKIKKSHRTPHES